MAFIDWFSRYVVSWTLDDTLAIAFVLDVLATALSSAKPEIWITDQGSHFTRPQVTQSLVEAGIQTSMDGKGQATDNIFTECFWRSLKYEEIYLADNDNPREARHGIERYIAFYNNERLHQALDYRRPVELYVG